MRLRTRLRTSSITRRLASSVLWSAAIADTLDEHGAGAPALATLVAAIVLSTLSLGVVFMTLGVLRLGNAIRYIPFPVIGAFLAYVAWLLLRGGMSTMVGQPLSLADSLCCSRCPTGCPARSWPSVC
jgi:SulP family sulfate permease